MKGGDRLEGDMRKISGVIEMLHILIRVVGMFNFKILQIVNLRPAYFTVYNLISIK